MNLNIPNVQNIPYDKLNVLSITFNSLNKRKYEFEVSCRNSVRDIEKEFC
jgi:hypothetical protein